MAEIPHISRHQNPLVGLAAGSVDKMLSSYVHWRNAAAAVADAYRVWRRAPAAQEVGYFAAYMAALDTEEAAATRYAIAVANLDRAL